MAEEPETLDQVETLAGDGATVTASGRRWSSDREISPRQGNYELVRKLGAGGMGVVFAARHVESDELVALKILSETAATRLYRFKREFRALADISHPNLIELHELVVPSSGPAFFTMELLDGLPFVDWVRGDAPRGTLPDLERLDHGLRGLIEAVHYLHIQGWIHRDLKPANVLVTKAGGRVVVLDFGLVSEVSEADQGVTRDGQLVGTPSYMAPEQARGEVVSAAADFYAIGVMLFECLTGRLPHEGSVFEQLIDKQSDRVLDPADLVDDVPPALRALCLRLLARNPDERPLGAELLEESFGATAPSSRLEPVFVGRTLELGALRGAFAELRATAEFTVVHLRGHSGHGKSRLTQRFRDKLRDQGAIVLHGRCREQEMVPYKGVDAIVDAISAYLRRLSSGQLEPLEPPDLDALERVFPVLDDIWPPRFARNISPAELRKLAGITLAELLRRIGETGPLLVHIDDFQWADIDSVELLEWVARASPRPAMMLLISYRSEEQDAEPVVALHDSDVLGTAAARMVELGPLPHEASHELARMLLEQAGLEASRAETIAMRAGGSPFYITQLASGPEQSTLDSSTDLDVIVARRLRELSSDDLRLLELVAVFGSPLSVEVATELHDLDERSETAEAIARLCERGMLVRAETDDGARVEIAHDRIRETLLAGLEEPQRAELHWALGQCLRRQTTAASGGELRGSVLFAIADQLAAGLAHQTELPPDERLELAALEQRAGTLSLEAGAWVAARRYLSCAHELLEPWMAEARTGSGQTQLCAAVTFALAQAVFAFDRERGSELVEELMEWELPAEEYSEIVQWYVYSLILVGKWGRAVELTVGALRRLGYSVPRRMSWARAGISYVLGRRATAAAGLTEGRELPPATDPRARAIMGLLGALVRMGRFTDIKLIVWGLGRYGRLLRDHGSHESLGAAVMGWALAAAELGRPDEAKAMCDLAMRMVSEYDISTYSKFNLELTLPLLLPMFYPLEQITPLTLEYYADIRKVAPQPFVEVSAVICINAWLGTMPPGEVKSILSAATAGTGRWKLQWVNDFQTHFIALMEFLSEGGRVSFDPEGTAMDEFQIGMMTAGHALFAVLCADFEAARELMNAMPKNYPKVLGVSWTAPAYAMTATIVEVETCLQQGTRLRSRAIRKYEKLTRTRAEYCPENYGPMLAMIEAEKAVAGQRHDDATGAYERARSLARKTGLTWLVGLASHRLARLALRREHELFARAAFEAAREAYARYPGALKVIDAELGAVDEA